MVLGATPTTTNVTTSIEPAVTVPASQPGPQASMGSSATSVVAVSSQAYPSRCNPPCTVNRYSSSAVEWPTPAACLAATSGHSTISPSSAGSPAGPSLGPWSTLPSSIGKASTSVGPSPPIQRWLSSAM